MWQSYCWLHEYRAASIISIIYVDGGLVEDSEWKPIITMYIKTLAPIHGKGRDFMHLHQSWKNWKLAITLICSSFYATLLSFSRTSPLHQISLPLPTDYVQVTRNKCECVPLLHEWLSCCQTVWSLLGRIVYWSYHWTSILIFQTKDVFTSRPSKVFQPNQLSMDWKQPKHCKLVYSVDFGRREINAL